MKSVRRGKRFALWQRVVAMAPFFVMIFQNGGSALYAGYMDGKVLFRYESNDTAANGLVGESDLSEYPGNLTAANGHLFDESTSIAENNAKVETGHDDKTTEYSGVAPRPDYANNTNPDFYLFGNVDDVLADDLPVIPVAREKSFYAISADLRGYGMRADSLWMDHVEKIKVR